MVAGGRLYLPLSGTPVCTNAVATASAQASMRRRNICGCERVESAVRIPRRPSGGGRQRADVRGAGELSQWQWQSGSRCWQRTNTSYPFRLPFYLFFLLKATNAALLSGSAPQRWPVTPALSAERGPHSHWVWASRHTYVRNGGRSSARTHHLALRAGPPSATAQWHTNTSRSPRWRHLVKPSRPCQCLRCWSSVWRRRRWASRRRCCALRWMSRHRTRAAARAPLRRRRAPAGLLCSG